MTIFSLLEHFGILFLDRCGHIDNPGGSERLMYTMGKCEKQEIQEQKIYQEQRKTPEVSHKWGFRIIMKNI